MKANYLAAIVAIATALRLGDIISIAFYVLDLFYEGRAILLNSSYSFESMTTLTDAHEDLFSPCRLGLEATLMMSVAL
jgi:hypothetical protein